MIIAMMIALLITNKVKADEVLLHKAWATAYSIHGITATNTETIEGKTLASKPEWFGCTAVVWLDDGDGIIKPANYIGTYTVEDTGGKNIRNGSVIDIYISSWDEAVEFGSKRVIMQIIKAEG